MPCQNFTISKKKTKFGNAKRENCLALYKLLDMLDFVTMETVKKQGRITQQMMTAQLP